MFPMAAAAVMQGRVDSFIQVHHLCKWSSVCAHALACCLHGPVSNRPQPREWEPLQSTFFKLGKISPPMNGKTLKGGHRIFQTFCPLFTKKSSQWAWAKGRTKPEQILRAPSKPTFETAYPWAWRSGNERDSSLFHMQSLPERTGDFQRHLTDNVKSKCWTMTLPRNVLHSSQPDVSGISTSRSWKLTFLLSFRQYPLFSSKNVRTSWMLIL